MLLSVILFSGNPVVNHINCRSKVFTNFGEIRYTLNIGSEDLF